MRFFQKKMVLLEILGDLQAGTTPFAAPQAFSSQCYYDLHGVNISKSWPS